MTFAAVAAAVQWGTHQSPGLPLCGNPLGSEKLMLHTSPDLRCFVANCAFCVLAIEVSLEIYTFCRFQEFANLRLRNVFIVRIFGLRVQISGCWREALPGRSGWRGEGSHNHQGH